MEHAETHMVTKDNGPRPFGRPDACFYCLRKVGQEHGFQCVLRRRTVVVRATIEYVIEQPSTKSPGDIEWMRNHGTWCTRNMLGELERMVKAGDCLCGRTKFEFVREATHADEQMQGIVRLDGHGLVYGGESEEAKASLG